MTRHAACHAVHGASRNHRLAYFQRKDFLCFLISFLDPFLLVYLKQDWPPVMIYVTQSYNNLAENLSLVTTRKVKNQLHRLGDGRKILRKEII